MGGDVMAECSLGCDDHEMVKFRNLRGGKKKEKTRSGEQALACLVIFLDDSHETALESHFSQ